MSARVYICDCVYMYVCMCVCWWGWGYNQQVVFSFNYSSLSLFEINDQIQEKEVSELQYILLYRVRKSGRVLTHFPALLHTYKELCMDRVRPSVADVNEAGSEFPNNPISVYMQVYWFVFKFVKFFDRKCFESWFSYQSLMRQELLYRSDIWRIVIPKFQKPKMVPFSSQIVLSCWG